MQTIQISHQVYHPVSQQIVEFKAALEVYVNREPQLSDLEWLECSQEDLSVVLLYLDEVMQGPTRLFRLLRDYIVFKGF